MESSQITQLIAYLSNQNPKVKAEALQIVLQLTATKESRQMVKQQELIKQLLRNMADAEMSQTIFSILINFSQDDTFGEELIELNGVQRIVDNLKENLIEYSKFTRSALTAALSKEERTAKEDKLLTVIQLELLLLSNLSQNDEAKRQILELHRDAEFHGLNFSFMLSWFNHPVISPTFHFFGNILANVTASKDTREFVLEPKMKLLEGMVNNLFSVEPNRRQGCIRAIRNCVFEYENPKFLEYLIDPKIDLLNGLLKCMLFNLTRGLCTDPDFDKELEEARALGKKHGLIIGEEDDIVNMQQVFDEMDILIDIFLIITNIDPEQHKLTFDADLMRFVLASSKLAFESDSFKDKLDVISVQLLKENPY